MLKKFEPKDVFALFLLMVLLIFKLTGHNGSLDVPAAIIVGYYFGRRNDASVHIPADVEKK